MNTQPLDQVDAHDRHEVRRRARLLGELYEMRSNLPRPVAVCVYDLYDATCRWSALGGRRVQDRLSIAFHAAELAGLPRDGLTPAHLRVVQEALRLAALVAEVAGIGEIPDVRWCDAVLEAEQSALPRLMWHPATGMLARWCHPYGLSRWHLMAADGSTPVGPGRVGLDPETGPGWVPVRLELDL